MLLLDHRAYSRSFADYLIKNVVDLCGMCPYRKTVLLRLLSRVAALKLADRLIHLSLSCTELKAVQAIQDRSICKEIEVQKDANGLKPSSPNSDSEKLRVHSI